MVVEGRSVTFATTSLLDRRYRWFAGLEVGTLELFVALLLPLCV